MNAKMVVPSVSVAGCFLFASVSADDALNYWRPVNGANDGAYVDAAHWSLGTVPDLGIRAYFACDASYTVTFPEGDFANNAALKPAAFPGRTVAIDGPKTTLVRAYDSTGRYPLETFGLYYGGTAYSFFNFEKYNAAPEVGKAADFAISNFVCRVSSSGENRVRGEFVKGGYNFFDPEGTAWTSVASPYVTFFGNGGSPLIEAEVVLGAETSFRRDGDCQRRRRDIRAFGGCGADLRWISGEPHGLFQLQRR